VSNGAIVSDPNDPELLHFVYFALPFLCTWWLEVETSNLEDIVK